MNMDFTAIDFETANRKRASACSIGLAKVRDGKVVDEFYRLIRPEPLEFDFINTSIHGISTEMVLDAPTMLELWPSIEAFIDGDVLVSHNSSFEQSVINQYRLMCGLEPPAFDYLCTLYMSKVNYPTRVSYKLDDMLLDVFGKKVNHHHALEDAIACAELGVHLMGLFRPQSARELISVLYDIPVREKQEWKKLTGIKPTKEELDPNHPLFEKSVTFTGVLSTMTREKAVQLLVDCGGIYKDAITKSNHFLVVGDQEYQQANFGGPSGKMKRAIEYNEKGGSIQTLTEEEFLRLVVP